MLVGENRDVGGLLQMIGDGEGARRRDVVDADRAKGRRKCGAGFDDIERIEGCQAERDGIDAGEGLEDDALAFFDGDRRLGRATLATEDIRTVGEESDRVAPACEVVGGERVVLDRQASLSNPRGVDQREDRPVSDRHFGVDADQPTIAPPVVEPFIGARWPEECRGPSRCLAVSVGCRRIVPHPDVTVGVHAIPLLYPIS